MKDIYSPLEIDEQWDQRAPLVEGDTAIDTMAQMAPDDGATMTSSGGVAVMDPPTDTASPMAPPNGIVGTSSIASADDNSVMPGNGMQSTPDNDPIMGQSVNEAFGDTQLNDITNSAPNNSQVTDSVDTSSSLDSSAMPANSDEASANMLSSQAEPQHILPEPPPLSQAGSNVPSLSTDTTNTVQPGTIEPIQQFQPDTDRTPATMTNDESTAATPEDVAKLDEAVAELPTSPAELKHESHAKTGLVVDDKADDSKADDSTDGYSKPAKSADDKRIKAVKNLESDIKGLKAEIAAKQKELKDQGDKRDAIEVKMADLQAVIDFKENEVTAFERAKESLVDEQANIWR